MKRQFFAVVMFVACVVAPALAQKAPELKRRPETVPLTQTEQIVVGAIADKLQSNAKDHAALMDEVPAAVAKKIEANQQEKDNLMLAVRAIEADMAAAHPGYHFDESTGKLTKDKPAEADSAAKEAAAKTDVKPEADAAKK